MRSSSGDEEGEGLSGYGEIDREEYCRVVEDEFGCEAIEEFLQADKGGEGSVASSDNFRWIRLEKEPDECLTDVCTREDVFRKIEEAKAVQRRHGPCELYPRQWEPTAADDDIINGAVNGARRKDDRSDQEFTVMQFNALAEGLSSGPCAKKPFIVDADVDPYAQSDEKQNNNGDNSNSEGGYGGFSSIPCPEIALDFSLRRWRIVEVLLRSVRDGSLFDLVAMQEIDRYRGFFSPVLRLFGYDGLFMPKTRSPCVRMGWYSDGSCLLWRSDAFELLSERRRMFRVGSQVYIVAVLRHIPTGRSVVAAVTHLKASGGNEEVRCRQMEELLDVIADARENLRERGEDDAAVLIMGDFNTDGETVRKVLDFRLQGKGGSGADTPILSAYEVNPPSDSLYTTWKIRDTETRRVIDYIFYSSNSLMCRATLQVPPGDQLEASKLPGLKYPSDHVAIAARFRIENE